jgi:hypothetical protein
MSFTNNFDQSFLHPLTPSLIRKQCTYRDEFSLTSNRIHPGQTRIHIKVPIVSLRNIKLTFSCAEIQIVRNQYISKCMIIKLLRFSLM